VRTLKKYNLAGAIVFCFTLVFYNKVLVSKSAKPELALYTKFWHRILEDFDSDINHFSLLNSIPLLDNLHCRFKVLPCDILSSL
jgi:hypothetical protein